MSDGTTRAPGRSRLSRRTVLRWLLGTAGAALTLDAGTYQIGERQVSGGQVVVTRTDGATEQAALA